MLQELEKRIQALEDLEAIRKLKTLYCYLADGALAGDVQKWDELMTHFVEEAWVEFADFGLQQGKEAAGRFFRETVHPLWSYAAHMVMNPIIEVTDGSARGRWFVHVACTARESNRAVWVQGKYEEEYVKVGAEWKWKSIRFIPDFFTPFDEGWVKTRVMDLE